MTGFTVWVVLVPVQTLVFALCKRGSSKSIFVTSTFERLKLAEPCADLLIRSHISFEARAPAVLMNTAHGRFALRRAAISSVYQIRVLDNYFKSLNQCTGGMYKYRVLLTDERGS